MLEVAIDAKTRRSTQLRWDVVAGMPYGMLRPAPPLPRVDADRVDARTALEAAVLRALQRPPCVVSFSGGRDSSAVLALGVMVARTTGLPLPVPVTLRYPSAPDTEESLWQDHLVRHLGLMDWVRVDLGDDHGFVGSVARRVLSRHGLLWPPNTHLHEPIVARASGGTLMTGVDGDGLFGSWRWRRTVRSALPPMAYVVRRVAGAAPSTTRRFVMSHAFPPPRWLRRDAVRAYGRYRSQTWEPEPWRWDDRVHWWWRLRYVHALRSSLDALAADHDVVVVNPLIDPGFVTALAREGGGAGLGDRTAIMRRLFSDVLPDATVRRSTKAHFDEVFWNRETRDYAERAGRSLPFADVVDERRIVEEWRSPIPHFMSAPLLQATWLHHHG